MVKSKPKVLLLGHLPPPYMGPSIATEIILRSSLKEHFGLYHLDTNTHKSFSTFGVWRLNKLLKHIVLYFKMVYLVLKHQPDLVVVPISQTTLSFIKDSIYILISRLFLCKTLLQLRGGNFRNWFGSATVITRAYVSKVLGTAQGVIVLGEKLRCLFCGFFTNDKIFVVPNGADYDITHSSNNNSDKLRILYLGNLQPSKGIEDVLNALLILTKNYGYLQFSADVVGEWRDGITRDKCLRLVSDNNLPVTFHPPVTGKKKFSYFTDANIFVFPPREPEGHPWVVVEAMAAGLPIISTDQGAITESVKDGVNGFIVDKLNPQQIAERVMLLIERPRLRKTMGEASQRLYLENFTEEKMVARMSQAFNAVLAR